MPSISTDITAPSISTANTNTNINITITSDNANVINTSNLSFNEYIQGFDRSRYYDEKASNILLLWGDKDTPKTPELVAAVFFLFLEINHCAFNQTPSDYSPESPDIKKIIASIRKDVNKRIREKPHLYTSFNSWLSDT